MTIFYSMWEGQLYSHMIFFGNHLLGESWIKTMLAWTFFIHCRETTRRWCGIDRYEIKTLHENHDDGQPRGRIGIRNMLKFMKCTPSSFFFTDCVKLLWLSHGISVIYKKKILVSLLTYGIACYNTIMV